MCIYIYICSEVVKQKGLFCPKWYRTMYKKNIPFLDERYLCTIREMVYKYHLFNGIYITLDKYIFLDKNNIYFCLLFLSRKKTQHIFLTRFPLSQRVPPVTISPYPSSCDSGELESPDLSGGEGGMPVLEDGLSAGECVHNSPNNLENLLININ